MNKRLMKFGIALHLVLTCMLVFVSNPVQALTDVETAGLRYMREEEKLAHDLYSAFYELWGNSLFANIAVSEQRHAEAVLSLLQRFAIADPAANTASGVFVNADLQTLYNELYLQGTLSLSDAVQAAITVEVTDVADLEAAIPQTSDPYIRRVYSNLLRGSQNHLAAFTNQLALLGVDSGGNNGLHPGISIFEPISKVLYIPAINVADLNGNIRVYDALLTVIETVPLTLRLDSAKLTNKLADDIHATYSVASGEVTIAALIVGALLYTTLEENSYTAVLQYYPEASTTGEQIFTVTSLALNGPALP